MLSQLTGKKKISRSNLKKSGIRIRILPLVHLSCLWYYVWLSGTHLDEDGDFGQVGLPGALGEALEAGGGFVVAVNGGEEGHRYSSSDDGEPHAGTHQRCVLARADGARAERVDDCQEAVHADAGEEEHAAVDISDEGRSWYLTQSVSKGPMAVNIVEDLEWQREDKHQVG